MWNSFCTHVISFKLLHKIIPITEWIPKFYLEVGRVVEERLTQMLKVPFFLNIKWQGLWQCKLTRSFSFKRHMTFFCILTIPVPGQNLPSLSSLKRLSKLLRRKVKFEGERQEKQIIFKQPQNRKCDFIFVFEKYLISPSSAIILISFFAFSLFNLYGP